MKVIWREIRKKLEGIEGGIDVVEKVERGEEAENGGIFQGIVREMGGKLEGRSWRKIGRNLEGIQMELEGIGGNWREIGGN